MIEPKIQKVWGLSDDTGGCAGRPRVIYCVTEYEISSITQDSGVEQSGSSPGP